MRGIIPVLLLSLSLVSFLFVDLLYEPKTDYTEWGHTSRDMYVELPELVEPELVLPEVIDEVRNIKQRLGEIEFPKTRLVFGDSHRMFITAYCSAECRGSTTTSSGATCHRETNKYEPTTCAIDRRYFRYGDLFYIPSEDRVYVAEDTGSGVRGMWIDTYQTSMSDVRGYNTRYETVYEVEIEHYTVLASNYDVRDMVLDSYFGK